ncbi:tetratricopeptide repeat protein [Prevotella dentasini]
MRLLLGLLLLCTGISKACAQPAAVRKAAEAAFTLTTYKKDGSVLATANGVFIGKDGTGVTLWSPFAGAERAVVADAKGEKHDVEVLLGANEIYNLAKLQINAATTAAPLASTATANSNAWIVTSTQEGQPILSDISEVEKFITQYNYCILKSAATDRQAGAPVVNEKGQVIGLFATSASGQQSATDAAYARDFSLTGLSQNDPVMRQCAIRIGLPDAQDQALIGLMLSIQKPKEVHRKVIDEFIAKFPTLNDGYFASASSDMAEGRWQEADKTLQAAVGKAENKGEAHFNYARSIYQAAITGNASAIGWTLEKAMTEAKEADRLNPQEGYKHLIAQIDYAKGNYKEAYNAFEQLTRTKFKNPELYLEMAQSREHLGAANQEILSLLNQSIELCDTPYAATAAPFFLARARQYDRMGDYRKAMRDYYTYEYFLQGTLGAGFYYEREQCEAKGHLWQQALQDILIASRLAPEEAVYHAEAGSLLLRVNKTDAAIAAAKRAISLKPDFADAHLVLGIAQCQSGQKEEGLKNISKAKELGNAQADSFLNKFK